MSAEQIEPAPTVDVQKPIQQTAVQSETLPSAPPSLWQQISNFFQGLLGQKNGPNTSTNTQQSPVHLPEIN